MLLRTCLAVLLAVSAGVQRSDPPLLVSAAISLTDALEAVAAAYEAAGGGPIRFNFAASNVLARQIVHGAPADLFISADTAQMDYAQLRGAIALAGARRPLLGNHLAVVTPSGHRHRIRDVAGLANARRIAIGDPAAVPAGVYAKQYLERAGVWDAVAPRLLPLANVRAALAAAESGGADAAIVYQSDAATSKNVDLAFVVTGAAAPRIIYPAAIVSRSRNKAAARRFLDFLQGPAAGAIFRRYGFLHGADLGLIRGPADE